MNRGMMELGNEWLADEVRSMIVIYCELDDLRPSEAIQEIFCTNTIRAIKEQTND